MSGGNRRTVRTEALENALVHLVLGLRARDVERLALEVRQLAVGKRGAHLACVGNQHRHLAFQPCTVAPTVSRNGEPQVGRSVAGRPSTAGVTPEFEPLHDARAGSHHANVRRVPQELQLVAGHRCRERHAPRATGLESAARSRRSNGIRPASPAVAAYGRRPRFRSDCRLPSTARLSSVDHAIAHEVQCMPSRRVDVDSRQRDVVARVDAQFGTVIGKDHGLASDRDRRGSAFVEVLARTGGLLAGAACREESRRAIAAASSVLRTSRALRRAVVTRRAARSHSGSQG